MRVGRMMTGCRMGAGLALALLLAGCHTTYRYSYEPSVQGEAKTQGKYYLRSCKVGDHLSEVKLCKGDNDGDFTLALLDGFAREGLDRIQSALPEVFADTGVPVDIVVRNDPEKRKSSPVVLSAFGTLFSLGILPCWQHDDEEYDVQVLVDGENGRVEGEFTMAEERCNSESSSGLNRLFPYQHRTDVRFTCEGSGGDGQAQSWKARAACKVEAYAYAIAATLAQMERDGKLSGVTQRQASQEKTEPKAKEPAALGRTLELRQLLDAGVISEEEYRREVERLKCGGRGEEVGK